MQANNGRNIRYRQKLRNRVRSLLGYCCVVCGKESKIEYAHIKKTKLNGVGRGMERRYLDIIKNPLAYVPMCHYHHISFDACEFELTLTTLLWGRNVIIYNPPRRPSNRRKGRHGDSDSKAIKHANDCPF